MVRIEVDEGARVKQDGIERRNINVREKVVCFSLQTRMRLWPDKVPAAGTGGEPTMLVDDVNECFAKIER